MALIPMQEPQAAVEELRRAVKELGMVGAMLPSTGLPNHLGAIEYWPVYEEAERLGCCLAVHGGAHSGIGLDYMNVYTPVHALGHPFGITISFAGILFNGIFDRYPGLRMAFPGGWGGLVPALPLSGSTAPMRHTPSTTCGGRSCGARGPMRRSVNTSESMFRPGRFMWAAKGLSSV